MRLKRKFFKRGAEEVARELLGKIIVRSFPFDCAQGQDDKPNELKVQITETEAYLGEHDLASHARFGRTKRTQAMYGEPGTVYMFFTYGVHWMLNIVCGEVGDPQAVLIREIRVVREIGEEEIVNGPGRLTKYLQLDGGFYSEDLTKSERLWVYDPEQSRRVKNDSGLARMTERKIVVTSRVGVQYAQEWAEKPLRFVLRTKVDKGRKK